LKGFALISFWAPFVEEMRLPGQGAGPCFPSFKGENPAALQSLLRSTARRCAHCCPADDCDTFQRAKLTHNEEGCA